MRETYMQKWKQFHSWTNQQALSPSKSRLSHIFDYLLSLKTSGLSLSSIKVHLAAIIAFHLSVDEVSVFVYPMMSRFIKGFTNFFPHIRDPVVPWDLNLILSVLRRPC